MTTTPNPRPQEGGAMYTQHNGLFVPAGANLTPEAAKLRTELADQRNLDLIGREDHAVRKASRAHYRNRLADITEKARAARRARKDRKRDAREQADLNRLYRVALRSGTRARIRADIQRSAEMRALRVNKVRTATLLVGMPVLAGFGIWSTAGAQAGTVRLLNLMPDTFAWTASWGVEPALIAIVAGIIIGKAMLKSSGGDTDWKAAAFEVGALVMSLGLNVIGGWVGGWDGIKTVLPHLIGPLGCAGTAALIGMFIKYATDACPWDGAPRLEDLGFVAANDAAVTATATVVDAPSEDPGDALAALAELPVTEPDDAAATRQPDTRSTRTDAPKPRPRGARAAGPVARRANPASPAATSSDAPGTDAATQAAHLVLTRGMSNREAAKQCGTSEATVRRRVQKIQETHPDFGRATTAGDAADADPDAESAERVMPLPSLPAFPLPTAAVTHSVNGHRPTPEEN